MLSIFAGIKAGASICAFVLIRNYLNGSDNDYIGYYSVGGGLTFAYIDYSNDQDMCDCGHSKKSHRKFVYAEVPRPLY